jgi:hypothetical protein
MQGYLLETKNNIIACNKNRGALNFYYDIRQSNLRSEGIHTIPMKKVDPAKMALLYKQFAYETLMNPDNSHIDASSEFLGK